MDVQRALKPTDIQELSTLAEQVTMSHAAERYKSKRTLIDVHEKRASFYDCF